MRSMKTVLGAMVLCLSTTEPILAKGEDISMEHAYSIPSIDAPELAKLGSYAVGVTERTFVDKDRPSLSAMLSGQGTTADRTIPVLFWYPATKPPEGMEPMTYTGRLPFRPGYVPENAPKSYQHTGIATADLRPAGDKKFPLIVISHGYGNWASHLSYLGENLASKGFIVASIEHSDQPYEDFQGFQLSFGSVLLNRTRDQRFVIDEIVRMSEAADTLLDAQIDASAIGLIGYSMGGYGLVNSIGAGYSTESPSFAQIPPALTSGIMAGDNYVKPHPNIKAALAFAPWGGSPINRAWNENALKDIKVPLMVIAGDQDDVSDYENGIRWIFEHAVNAPRQFLVYENARHNTGGNPPPPIAGDFFDLVDWFDEPVWRRDRISGINQHFATAFFGLHLQNNKSMKD